MPSSIARFPFRCLAEAAEEYVRSRGPGRLVSTREGMLHMRDLYPHSEHTDLELAEIIASCAVRSGCAVSFDHCDRVRVGSDPYVLPADGVEPPVLRS